MNAYKGSTWALALAATLASLSQPAQAQQLIAWPVNGASVWRMILPGRPLPPHPFPLPRPGPIPRPLPPPHPLTPPEVSPVTLAGYNVDGTITDQAAELAFDITFHNPTNARLEGVLLVPIPADTVLSGFSMTVGGHKMNGELLEAEKAGAIYQSIVQRMRDPALLELVGERLFRARVFPIEPNADVSVRLTLTQVLRKSGDLVSLTVPLRSAQMLQGTTGRARVSLNLNTTKPIRTLYSPNPDVQIRRTSEQAARVTYEGKGTPETSDLSLFYSMREDPLAASLLSFKEEGEDGYFMLSLSPRPQVDQTKVLPKDVVFIVDRSGSMEENGKMEQAKKALAYCIRGLSARDRFGIVDFATDSNSMSDRLLPANQGHKTHALRYIENIVAAGGTNIEAGLNDGLKLLSHSPGRVPMVFFLTDGLPTVGQTDIPALLKKAAAGNQDLRARLFSFGVGSDVNTLFLDKLAEENRGARDYVSPGEDIEAKISTLYQKVAKPAMSDVRISWNGAQAQEVYPRPITDLFYGSELVLMGRYKAHGKGTLVVTGRTADQNARFEFPIELPERAPRHAFLPRLWASLKVTHTLDAIRLSGRADPEVVKDIVKLAKRYGIVTPYTSYLITEEGTNMQTAQNAAVSALRGMAFEAASSGFDGGAGRARSAQKASGFLGRLSGQMQGMISGAGGSMAAAPETAMRDAEREVRKELDEKGQAAAEIRTVGGKTFYKRGKAWVDGEFELSENKASALTIKIVYLSPEYFELLNKHRDIGRYLSLGTDMTLTFAGSVYQIVSEPAQP